MGKSFRYFRKPIGTVDDALDLDKVRGKHLYRYSMYMQSKDEAWLSRNSNAPSAAEDEDEPIEEDIRD